MNDWLFEPSRVQRWFAVLGLVGACFHFVWGWLVPYLTERRIKKARAQAERAFR